MRPDGKSCNEEDNGEHSLLCEVLLCRLERDVGQEVVQNNTASELNSQILRIKQKLEAANNNDEEILDALCSLNNVAMSIELLRSTEIGKMVSKLKNSANSTISMMAKELVTKWKEIANNTKDDEPPKPVAEFRTKHSSPVFSYTVKVPHGDGTFHIEENIAHDRVKYHHNKNAPRPDKGVYQTELMNHSKKHEQYENEIAHTKSCQHTSPSTLTNPDSALDQLPSDICSQPSSHKRKSEHNDESSKCLRTSDGPVWTPPKGYGAQPGITPKQLYSNHLKKECVKIPLQIDDIPWILGSYGNVIKDMEEKSGCTLNIKGRGTKKGRVDEPSHIELIGDTNSIKRATELIQERIDKKRDDECVIIPIRTECIPRILGPHGQIINHIKIKSGCRILIRGKGTANDTSDEPPHAKIYGDASAVERATKMIEAILQDEESTQPHADMQDYDNFTTFSLSPLHISRIIGKHGSVIKDIEMKTHCQIYVPKKEHHNNDKLQVKIYGKHKYDVETAVRIINDRVSDIERSDQIDEQKHGVVVSDVFTTLPLKSEQISRIVGTNGANIKEVEQNSGSQISIRGKGSKRVDYPDEPLHARITGSPLARESALKIMLSKISTFNTP